MADSTLITPSRRATLIGVAVLASSAVTGGAKASPVSPTVQKATSHTQLYNDALAAYGRWWDFCIPWSKMIVGTPEYQRSERLLFRAGDEYEAAFRKCCEFHAESPSILGLGEVYALWKTRCWSDADGPDEAADEFELRALCQIIESLSGIVPPEGPCTH